MEHDRLSNVVEKKPGVKLFFVTYSLRGGGAEKVFTSVVEYLAKKNHELHVLTFEDKGIYAERIKSLGVVKYHTIDLKKNRVNFIIQSIKIRQIFKSVAPDKIVSFLHYPNMICYLACLLTRYKHIPAERSNHRRYIGKGMKWKLWKYLLKKTYRNSNLILCNSTLQKKFLAKDFKVPEDKIVVIHNGIALDQLVRLAQKKPAVELNNDKRLIVAVGRMAKVKGYDILIRSFNELLSEKSELNLRLMIVGEGPELESLKSLASNLGILDYITFAGFQVNPFPIIKQAQVYVLSSLYEGFPNALVEAMWINGHVVATNCDTGPSEIIDHKKDGLLVHPDDIDSLADGIKQMLNDENLRSAVYLNSREKSKTFDIKRMFEAYEKVLLE